MLKLKVTYFLNDKGADYFQSWFDEVLNETKKQKGFLDMELKDSRQLSSPTVYLTFESQELLDRWSSQSIHDELASKIEPYFLQDRKVEIQSS
ncbi:MAG TPA: hypothetical protein PLO43_01200 [Chlamydiales bacterium]|nr:hypothetical protein [Chlamydiales bacterium]HPE84780.1 hypothetical protein [Chlamydiales bacterium]